MNEDLIFNMLKNINVNMGTLKTHGRELKTGFEDLKNQSVKYHTIVDILNTDVKGIENKLETIIKNGTEIKNIKKQVDNLTKIGKHGFIIGVASTFIISTVISYEKIINLFSG